MPSGVVTPPNISLFHLFSRDQDKETNKVSTLGEMKKRSLKLKTTKHLLRRIVNGCKHQVQKTDLENKLAYKNWENIYLGKKKSVLLRRPIWSHWLYCGTQSTAWKSYRVTSFYNLSVYNTLTQMYDDSATQKTWLFCIFLLFYTI